MNFSFDEWMGKLIKVVYEIYTIYFYRPFTVVA